MDQTTLSSSCTMEQPTTGELPQQQGSDQHRGDSSSGSHPKECDCCDSVGSNKHKKWHFYQLLQRAPAFFNCHINYPQNNWISTRELARRIDELQQYTHSQASVAEEVAEKNFLLLDARGKREYRTSHITGALHLPVSARNAIYMRPGRKSVQQHFYEPTPHMPQHLAIGNKTFHLLSSLPKDIEIVVYCAVGFRSGWLARALTIQGFKNTSCLHGGVYKWANEGREIFQYKEDQTNPEYDGTSDKYKKKMQSLRVPKKNPKGSEHKVKVDSQGQQPIVRHEEVEAFSLLPHQFIASGMIAPNLKPHEPTEQPQAQQQQVN